MEGGGRWEEGEEEEEEVEKKKEVERKTSTASFFLFSKPINPTAALSRLGRLLC